MAQSDHTHALAAQADDEPRAYRRALGHYMTGVVVITADGQIGAPAITINSFVSISLEPRLVMWSLAMSSDRYERFAAAERWCASVLSADQQSLAMEFARKGARGAEEHELERPSAGIKGALARFCCTTASRIPAGDHLMILGAVERFDTLDGDALTYHRGAFGR